MSTTAGNNEPDRKTLALILLWGIIIAVVFCLLASCKEIQYVEKPVTHTEYVYRDRVDSAAVHDSVYIKEYQKGDTIKVVEYRYKDRFRYIYATDTLIQRDTVSVVHTEVVEKTVAKMNSLQGAFFWLGLLTFICVIGYGAYKVFMKKLRA